MGHPGQELEEVWQGQHDGPYGPADRRVSATAAASHDSPIADDHEILVLLDAGASGEGADEGFVQPANYYDRRHAERAKRHALSTLKRQGYRVTLETVA